MLVGYIRVSTADQNLNLQKDTLIKYGVDERNIFSDKTSGSKDKRVGLDKAIEFLKEGDTLVVWKLDRLGRSLAHLISVITSLKNRNISFASITEGMDTTTASGELFFHIFGALAQFERSLIQERVNAGLEAARQRGIRGGRPRAIDDEKLIAMKKALDDGMSKAAICRTFNVKRSTLIDSLNRS
ncbi:recombinase family protein [Poseidonibacter lekithochrous]|uniref:recombinase family protein n=1 Tax=Poseidonibacter TaxID=2321187 RepID=UPI001C08558E|nr:MULTISPECIES: recombinase family protein [Poseidonibacter]MBU3014635.1 recombinase family protein [Poseidonibacter lekithochrous]MDO6827933.1 recombinase family protein [Poseidonibacter sp. 1_MG-2023]